MRRAILHIFILSCLSSCFGQTLSGADALNTWNRLFSKLAAEDPPHLQSRGLAVLNLAIHDAVNAVQPRFGAYRLEGGAYTGGSPEAAAASAGRHLLPAILPPSALPEIEAAYAPLLNAVTDPGARGLGVTAGQAAAALLVKERMGDLALIDGADPARQSHRPLSKHPSFEHPQRRIQRLGPGRSLHDALRRTVSSRPATLAL